LSDVVCAGDDHIMDPPCLSAVVPGTRDEAGKGWQTIRSDIFVRRVVNEYRIYRPVGADHFMDMYPGLKPRAEYSPFGTKG
jgi:hypothetical protein